MKEYPHQLSGGMCQRAMIAMALSCDPDLLIADEPTTALDVTVQAQILDLINRMKKEREMAVILITHDLGVVAEMADDVTVMRHGRVMEYGTVERIFHQPGHEYTKELLAQVPRLDHPSPVYVPPKLGGGLMNSAVSYTGIPRVLTVKDLVRHFQKPRRHPFEKAQGGQGPGRH